MAKLTNVKTVDMVNGEITKVAYEGAEYLLTTEKAVEGDLITFLPSARRDVTQGEFYKVTGVCHFNDTIRMIDDVEDDHYWFRENPKFKTFRKISADKPTLEQRVGALESDVAALKGEKKSEETIEFEGATYRKVEREAREGDVVIFTNETAYRYFITKNQPYKVIADGKFVDNDGDRMTIYRNDSDQNRTRETVDVYEPIEQAQYVPQEGDIVVVTGNTNDSENKVGDIGKVTVVDYDDMDARVLVPNGKDYSNWTEFSDIRKATSAEVEKYEQAVKDAEIAEKWAKIGRKPNEFKKGDAVFVTHSDGGKVYGIIHEDSCGHKIKVDFGKRYSICTEEKSELTLVAPVESLFNA